jgi:leishmanolysin
MRAIIFALLLTGLALSHVTMGGIAHKCVHDTKFKDNEIFEMPSMTADEKARILASIDIEAGHAAGVSGGVSTDTNTTVTTPKVNDGWHSFRIGIDYSYADKLIQSNPSLKTKYQLSIRLVESVRNYFQKFFQVNYFPDMDFKGGSCQGNKIDAFVKPVDLYITIAPENDPKTEYFAAAAPCYISPRDGRPTIGAYILNFAFLETGYLNEYLYFSTFAHEFTHILGFTDNLFPKFVHPGTTTKRTDVVGEVTISGEKFSAITMPEVVNYARNFFKCSNIPGVPLENNGGSGSAGSHWEKLFLPQEYMNPTVENPGILSEFTFTFLRATGWYQIDSTAAQRYDWGQESGCGHFNVCPQNTDGYCSAGQVSQSICSSEWMSKGVCVQDRTFSSGCYVKRSREHTCLLTNTFQPGETEYYGENSRCINYKGSSGYAAQCHKVSCSAGGIEITVGTKKVICLTNEAGTTKDVGLTFQLQCPNYNDFCGEFNSRCPGDCNAQGMCTVGKQCFCFTGFSGNTCSSKSPIDYAKVTSGSYYGSSASNLIKLMFGLISALIAHFSAF